MHMLTCRVCGNTERNTAYSIHDMMFTVGVSFNYFECSNCGCLQISKVPEDLSKYYPADYYSYSEKPGKSTFSKLAKSGLSRALVFSKRLAQSKLLRKFSPYLSDNLMIYRVLNEANININSRMLDVGCGAGSLLYNLKNMGFKNVLGVDPFISEDIFYDNQLRIIKSVLSQIAGVWDIILFNHSFEHIQDELDTLKSVRSLLGVGGVCVLNMPTTSSFAWKHYRENWVQIDAPRHLQIHSVDSIKILAGKAGLKLHDVMYTSSSLQFWGSEQNCRGIPLFSDKSYAKGLSKSIFSEREISDFRKRAVELNNRCEGDSAAFFLIADAV